MIYGIIDKRTASQKVIVGPWDVEHEETQGRLGQDLYTKLAPETLKHYRTSAVMLQAITSATTATKYAYAGGSMSTLEAMVSAPTVEHRTEDCCTNPRCDQRTQARQIEMNTIRSGI